MSQQVRQVPPPHRPQEPPRREAADAPWLVALTTIGILISIPGALVTVFAAPAKVALPAISLGAIPVIGLGVYALRRRWAKPLGFATLAPISCITAGAVVLALMIGWALPSPYDSAPGPKTGASSADLRSNGSADPGRPPSTGLPSPTATGVNGTGVDSTAATEAANPPSGSHATGDSQVRLEDGTGTDIDGSDPKATPAEGPNGALDLYLDGSGLRANNHDFYQHSGPGHSARDKCERLTREQREYGFTSLTLFTGDQYCFRTSSGRVAWLRINDRGTDYVVVNVLVWK